LWGETTLGGILLVVIQKLVDGEILLHGIGLHLGPALVITQITMALKNCPTALLVEVDLCKAIVDEGVGPVGQGEVKLPKASPTLLLSLSRLLILAIQLAEIAPTGEEVIETERAE
jgi:hypothetical protein